MTRSTYVLPLAYRLPKDKSDMLSYPARIARDGDGFMVLFPDIPEALTGAATREGALAQAADALTTAMDFYFEDRRQVPAPSAPKRGQVTIDLPPSAAPQ